MNVGATRKSIGQIRNRSAPRQRWDVRLVAVGFVGALAGGLYTTFPAAGGNNMPDEYILRVDNSIGDVEPLTLDELAQTIISARGHNTLARDRQRSN